MPERTVYKYHTQGYTLSATAGGASANVIYTCPPNYNGTVRFLHISNSDNSTQNCSVQFYHAEDDEYHFIMNNTSLAGKSILNLVDGGYFFMHAGDKIVAYSAASPASFDILVSVEEEPAQFTFTGA